MDSREERREILVRLFRAAVAAVDPEEIVRARAAEARSFLRACGRERLHLLAFGKAADAMARGALEAFGELVESTLVIAPGDPVAHRRELSARSPEGLAGAARRWERIGAEHPIPGAGSLRAAEEALRRAAAIPPSGALLCLVSGGGSSLLCAPAEGIDLAAKAATIQTLLRGGADIRTLNTVRKHLSRVKGGRLAAAAAPTPLLSWILSDVVGDPPESIASGPTSPDPSTYVQASAALVERGVLEDVPASVRRHLARGIAGEIPETPKPGDPVFARVEHTIVGNSSRALAAAREEIEAMGASARLDPRPVTGEARHAGAALARRALEFRASAGRRARGLFLLSGGETTVTVRGEGRGGRNMELALGFALETAGEEGLALLSAGTDGIDGPTDAAGAFADGTTLERARAAGFDAREVLRRNDSYALFERLGDLFRTGPTGTNVMDLQIVSISGNALIEGGGAA